MSARQRDRRFRMEQAAKHRDKARKPGGPKRSKREAYQQNKRNALRADLRTTNWDWL